MPKSFIGTRLPTLADWSHRALVCFERPDTTELHVDISVISGLRHELHGGATERSPVAGVECRRAIYVQLKPPSDDVRSDSRAYIELRT